MRAKPRFYMSLGFVFLFVLAGEEGLEAKEHKNSIGMEFQLIHPGSFVMGALLTREDAMESETPRHIVSITKAFYLGKHEVTQEQFETVMGHNPSLKKGKNLPVEYVSWQDAQLFVQKLNRMENSNGYRLPTEAEWEYAARGGTSHIYFFGNDQSDLDEYAWYEENSGLTTHEVGLKKPNALGLHDIYGNVREWVHDRFGNNYYRESPAKDPKGPPEGDFRVSRGCSWMGSAWNCRSASREPSHPNYRFNYMGFRVAFSVE